MKKAFRCKHCDHLEPAAHAGERVVPCACSVCKAGVRFLPDGTKRFLSENWEVLADCSPDVLATFGLSPEDVERHVPAPKGAPHQTSHHERTAEDGPGTNDKA